MKEGRIYLFLGIIAFMIFNVGAFIFSYQRLYEVVGPYKGSISIISFMGCLVHAIIFFGSCVFLYFRLKDKDPE